MASRYETIMEAIVSRLSEITAGSSGYVYSPESVRRLTWFPVEWQPDPTFATQYVIHPGDETHELRSGACRVSQAEVFVVLFRKAESVDPSDAWPIANDLVADCCQAIFASPGFGLDGVSLADNSIFVDRTPSAETPGWVVAGVRFIVRYHRNADER